MFHALTALVVLLGSSLFLRRLARLRNTRPSQGGTVSTPATISIVVPARNEAHNLPTLLASLRALSPPAFELIVVDDHSTDETASIARSYGARVVVPAPLEPGFIGKTWACLAGASRARGSHVVFTDADTWHAPDSLTLMLSQLTERQAGLASIVPTHRLEAPWERFQGVFQLLLLLATRAGAPDTPGSDLRRYANGQYLMFTRAAYDAIGGHRAVAPYIAEDLAFARQIERAGLKSTVVFALGAVRVRMYPEGLGAFVAGWRRNFREGMAAGGSRALLEMTVLMGWLLGTPICLVHALVQGRVRWAVGWLFAYLATAFMIAREQRHYGPFPAWSALFYPIFAGLFAVISALSAWDSWRKTPARWRGRDIDVVR